MFTIIPFHGTSISIFQNPTMDNYEDERPNADDIHQGQESPKFLIISCTNISSVLFPNKNPSPAKDYAMAFTFLSACTM
jgi:hypothetical protein